MTTCPASRVALLVHGTWAPNSPWTLQGSNLRNALNELGFTTQTFKWNARNSIRGRGKAATELAARLRSLREEFPDAEIVVISHSHGGNVSLHAVNNSGVKVAGLVTMATPFLQVKERRPQFFWLAVSGLFDVTWAISQAYMFMLAAHLSWFVVFGLPLLTSTVVGILLMTFWFFVSMPLAKALWPHLDSPSPNCPVLAVRMVGDEASITLVGLGFLGWVTSKAAEKVDAVISFLKKYRFGNLFRDLLQPDTKAAALRRLPYMLFGVTLASCVCYVILTRWINVRYSPTLRFLIPLISGPTCWQVAIIFIGDIVALPFAVPVFFSSLTLASIGPELILAAPMLAISVEQVPVGRLHSIALLPPPDVDDLDTPYVAEPLAHSAVWDDAAAISIIKNWLVQIARVSP